MRITLPALFLCLCVAQQLRSQVNYQQRQDLTYQKDIDKLDAGRAALKEDVKNANTEIMKLQDELSKVREIARAADMRSSTNSDDIGTIKWVGRGILGAVAFLVGVVVTQGVGKFMAIRKPRIIAAKG